MIGAHRDLKEIITERRWGSLSPFPDGTEWTEGRVSHSLIWVQVELHIRITEWAWRACVQGGPTVNRFVISAHIVYFLGCCLLTLQQWWLSSFYSWEPTDRMDTLCLFVSLICWDGFSLNSSWPGTCSDPICTPGMPGLWVWATQHVFPGAQGVTNARQLYQLSYFSSPIYLFCFQ